MTTTRPSLQPSTPGSSARATSSSTWQTTEVDLPAYVCRGYFSVTGRTVQFTRTRDMPGGDCMPPDWIADWRPVEGGIEWSSVRTWPSTWADFVPFFEGFTWERID